MLDAPSHLMRSLPPSPSRSVPSSPANTYESPPPLQQITTAYDTSNMVDHSFSRPNLDAPHFYPDGRVLGGIYRPEYYAYQKNLSGCTWKEGLDIIETYDWSGDGTATQDADGIGTWEDGLKAIDDYNWVERIDNERQSAAQEQMDVDEKRTEDLRESTLKDSLVRDPQLLPDVADIEPLIANATVAAEHREQLTESTTADDRIRMESETNLMTSSPQVEANRITPSSPPWISSPSEQEASYPYGSDIQNTKAPTSPRHSMQSVESVDTNELLAQAIMEVDREASDHVKDTMESVPHEEPEPTPATSVKYYGSHDLDAHAESNEAIVANDLNETVDNSTVADMPAPLAFSDLISSNPAVEHQEGLMIQESADPDALTARLASSPKLHRSLPALDAPLSLRQMPFGNGPTHLASIYPPLNSGLAHTSPYVTEEASTHLPRQLRDSPQADMHNAHMQLPQGLDHTVNTIISEVIPSTARKQDGTIEEPLTRRGNSDPGPEQGALLLGLEEAAAAAVSTFTSAITRASSVDPSSIVAPVNVALPLNEREESPWAGTLLEQQLARGTSLLPSPYATISDQMNQDANNEDGLSHTPGMPVETAMTPGPPEAPIQMSQQEDLANTSATDSDPEVLSGHPKVSNATPTPSSHIIEPVSSFTAETSTTALNRQVSAKFEESKPAVTQEMVPDHKGKTKSEPDEDSDSEFEEGLPAKKKQRKNSQSPNELSKPGSLVGSKPKAVKKPSEAAKPRASKSIKKVPNETKEEDTEEMKREFKHIVDSPNTIRVNTAPPTKPSGSFVGTASATYQKPANASLELASKTTSAVIKQSLSAAGKEASEKHPLDLGYGKRHTRADTKYEESRSSVANSPVGQGARRLNTASSEEMLVDAEETAEPKAGVTSKTKAKPRTKPPPAQAVNPNPPKTTRSKAATRDTTPKVASTVAAAKANTPNKYGFKPPRPSRKPKARKSEGDVPEKAQNPPIPATTQLKTRQTRRASAAQEEMERQAEKATNIGKRLRSGDMKK